MKNKLLTIDKHSFKLELGTDNDSAVHVNLLWNNGQQTIINNFGSHCIDSLAEVFTEAQNFCRKNFEQDKPFTNYQEDIPQFQVDDIVQVIGGHANRKGQVGHIKSTDEMYCNPKNYSAVIVIDGDELQINQSNIKRTGYNCR